MKKILLIVATHGDEKIGLEVVEKLKNFQKYFDVLVANPRALRAGQRFIDSDLNRAYPGNRFSKNYEERLACKNFRTARKYKYVIDIHEASQGSDDFIIIPRDCLGGTFPINRIILNKILFWPYPQGSISQFLENSIELEFGMKNRSREEALKKATKVVKVFILETVKNKNTKKRKKEKFYVFGSEATKDIKNINRYVDFKKANIGGKNFYPLLVGQYEDVGIAFYKMKKIL